MPQNYASSVLGVSMRVTRLNPDGTLSTVTGDSIVTNSFIQVSFTHEYEEGTEITQKRADGSLCISYTPDDTLKQMTFEISICEPDPELTQLLGGGVLLSGIYPGDTSETALGWASPQVGENPSGDGVALEVWSYALVSGRPDTVMPYWHWIFPNVRTRLTGDRVIEEGSLATTFEGTGLGNIQFANGPDGRWDFPAVADRPYAYSRAAWSPKDYKGMVDWDVTTGVGTPASDDLYDPANNPPGINIPGTDGYTPPADYVLSEVDNPTPGTNP